VLTKFMPVWTEPEDYESEAASAIIRDIHAGKL